MKGHDYDRNDKDISSIFYESKKIFAFLIKREMVNLKKKKKKKWLWKSLFLKTPASLIIEANHTCQRTPRFFMADLPPNGLL